MSKHTIYIGIGTNLDDAGIVLSWTKRKLAVAFRGEQRFSTPQKTVPVKFPSTRMFTNQLVRIETAVPPIFIRPLLKNLERQFGRKPEDKAKGLVKLDLDLLCLDGQVLKADDWERDYIIAARSELD